MQKYGKPPGNVGGRIELITGPAFERMAFYVAIMGRLDDYDGDYVDYDEWDVDTPGGHVKIDLISYYHRNMDFDYFYRIDVSYHFYTDADYAQAFADKAAERNKVDDL